MSEGDVVLAVRSGLLAQPLPLQLLFQRAYETHGACYVVEDQQALVVVQDRVVVREALVVAHVVERLQHRDRGLQDAGRHLRLEMAVLAQALDVLAKERMQRLLTRDRDAARLAQRAYELDNEGV